MFAPLRRCWSTVPLTLRYPTKGAPPRVASGRGEGSDFGGLEAIAIDSGHASAAFKTMCIYFRPNFFGRSFGRKFGVLYDDYVKDVFVSACAINKMEEEVVLHTQEVTGSSPVAPTISFQELRV